MPLAHSLAARFLFVQGRGGERARGRCREWHDNRACYGGNRHGGVEPNQHLLIPGLTGMLRSVETTRWCRGVLLDRTVVDDVGEPSVSSW